MNKFPNANLWNELHRLENIVQKDLAAFLEDGSELDEWLIIDFKNALKEEIDIIRESLNKSILYLEKKHTRQAYIQYHQKTLAKLAADLLNYVGPNQLNVAYDTASFQLLAYLIYRSIEELLTFVEIQFSKYYDHTAWVPPGYLRITQHHIGSNLDSIHEDLLKLDANTDLLSIALLPLSKFINADNSTYITYHDVNYLKQYKQELLYLSRQCTPVSIDRSLRTLLHTINFNSPEYCNYCIAYMQRELKSAEGSELEQRYILAKFRRYLHQVQVRPGFALDVNGSTLTDVLSHWIGIEAEYLQESTLEFDTIDSSASPGFKVMVDMTVGQISYLIRVLFAVGVIQNKSKTAVTKFLTSIFQTQYTDVIASGSMRKKLYGKSDAVRKAVKKILERCIAYIDADTGENDRK